MKKLISMIGLVCTIIAISAFTSNLTSTSQSNAKTDDWYFFISANPNKVYNEHDSKKRYISGIFHYTDNGNCNNPYQRQIDAKRAFGSYLKAEYNDIENLDITVLGDFYMEKKYSSKTLQDAKEKQNRYIADEKQEGNSVVKTYFEYPCK